MGKSYQFWITPEFNKIVEWLKSRSYNVSAFIRQAVKEKAEKEGFDKEENGK